MKQAFALLLFSAILLWSLRANGSIANHFNHSQKEQSAINDEEQEPNLDGVVEVSFKIDNTGKVQIINMNSTSPQLAEYVIKKLSKIQLQQGDSQMGKIIRYRFVFKKQA